MQSNHALILALLAGAGALLVALAALLTLHFLNSAEPYLTGKNRDEVRPSSAPTSAPNLITKLDGSGVRIVELGKRGEELRTIYSSDLGDAIADFSLFAIPQSNYQGTVYVRSLADTNSPSLIVYPLAVETGIFSPAILNVPSDTPSLSLDQTKVAVITPTAQQLMAYDIASGRFLASWTLATDETLADTTPTIASYDGEGVRWVTAECFEHTVAKAAELELRRFCIEGDRI